MTCGVKVALRASEPDRVPAGNPPDGDPDIGQRAVESALPPDGRDEGSGAARRCRRGPIPL